MEYGIVIINQKICDNIYGAGWGFSIELLSIEEMKRGAGTHYPYVTGGKGKGILEDTSPYEQYE